MCVTTCACLCVHARGGVLLWRPPPLAVWVFAAPEHVRTHAHTQARYWYVCECESQHDYMEKNMFWRSTKSDTQNDTYTVYYINKFILLIWRRSVYSKQKKNIHYTSLYRGMYCPVLYMHTFQEKSNPFFWCVCIRSWWWRRRSNLLLFRRQPPYI